MISLREDALATGALDVKAEDSQGCHLAPFTWTRSERISKLVLENRVGKLLLENRVGKLVF